MPDEAAGPDAITAQRDEALRRLESERAEFAAALRTHRANELHLAEVVRETQRQLMQARDAIPDRESRRPEARGRAQSTFPRPRYVGCRAAWSVRA
jgi:hypothetical protein